MYNQTQINAKLESNAHRSRGEYEASGFRKGVSWFYPCDDYVIRCRHNGSEWRAVLSRMDNRDHGIKAWSGITRAQAVLMMLMHMRDVGL